MKVFFLSILAALITLGINAQYDINEINQLQLHGNYSQIIDLLSEEEKLSVELSQLKANAYKNLNNFDKAIPLFQHALQKNETCANYLNLAQCYTEQGLYYNALPFLEKGKALCPKNAFIQTLLAQSYYQSEMYLNAINEYKQLWQSDSSIAYNGVQLAKSYIKVNYIDTARVLLQNLEEIFPNNLMVISTLTNFYLDQEIYVLACKTTDRYINTGNYDRRINRYNAYSYYKDPMKMNKRPAYEKFKLCYYIHFDTTHFTTKFFGISAIYAERTEEAEYVLKKAFLKDSTDANTNYYLGVALSRNEKYAEAEAFFKRSIDILTPSPLYMSMIYQERAYAFNKLGKPQKGLEMLEIAYETAPEDTVLLYKIASQYDYELKQPKKAIEKYEVFIATRPKQEDVPKPDKGVIGVSYYNAAINRVNELKEVVFWEGKE